MVRGRKALFRQFYARSDHLLKGHGAVALQCRQPGVAGGGDHASRHPKGHVAVVPLLILLQRGSLGPTTQPTYGHHLFYVGPVENDGCYACETGKVREGDIDGDARSYSGVNGITTILQDPKAGEGSEIMPRRNHIVSAHKWDAVGRNSIRWHRTPPESFR